MNPIVSLVWAVVCFVALVSVTAVYIRKAIIKHRTGK